MSELNLDQLLVELSNLNISNAQIPGYAVTTNVAGSYNFLTIHIGYVQFAQDVDVENPEVIVDRSTMDRLWAQACCSWWQVLKRQEEAEEIPCEKRIATVEDLKSAILQKWFVNGVEEYWHSKTETSPDLQSNTYTIFDLDSDLFECNDGASVEQSPLFYKSIKARRDAVARERLEGFDPSNTQTPWQAPPKYYPDEPLRKRSTLKRIRPTSTEELQQSSPPRRPFMSAQLMNVFDNTLSNMMAAMRDTMGSPSRSTTPTTPKTPKTTKRSFTNAFSELHDADERLQRIKHQKIRQQMTTEESPEYGTRRASGKGGFRASRERQEQLNGWGR